MDFWSVIAALALGLFGGALGRMLTPNDAFRHMSGPKSWGISLGLGLLGAALGYWLFSLIGIGDSDVFDWGGVIGAVIGSIVVVVLASFILKRTGRAS
jgi:uncharacterized membrane protein YeaQ/YmgE (transglycosylase-associated protein family)